MSISVSIFEWREGSASISKPVLHEHPIPADLHAFVTQMQSVGFVFTGSRPPTYVEAKLLDYLRGSTLLQLMRVARGPAACVKCGEDWGGLRARVINAGTDGLERLCARCVVLDAATTVEELRFGMKARKAGFLS